MKEEDFKANGFLCDTSELSKSSIAKFSREYRIFTVINKLLMGGLWKTLPPRKNGDHILYAIKAIARSIKSYQLSIRLWEIGALEEAETLTRSATEAAILAYGLHDGHVSLAALQQSQDKHTKAFINSITEEIRNKDDIPTNVSNWLEENKAYIDEKYGRGTKIEESIKYDQIAQKCGISHLYTFTYRSTSSRSAHTTLESLNRFDGDISESNETQNLQFSPRYEETYEFTLDTIRVGFIICQLLEKYLQDPEFSAQLQYAKVEAAVYHLG